MTVAAKERKKQKRQESRETRDKSKEPENRGPVQDVPKVPMGDSPESKVESRESEQESEQNKDGHQFSRGQDSEFQTLLMRLEIPLAKEPQEDQYIPRRLHIPLDRDQAAVVDRMLSGLDASDARLSNGRHIESRADVIRWLLDVIAESN